MQHLGYTLKIDNCFEEVERVFMGKRWEEREKILWILSIEVEKGSAKQGGKEPSLILSVHGDGALCPKRKSGEMNEETNAFL